MSLRSVEEGLTSLSYPRVGYRLEKGYGDPLTLIVGAVTGVTKMVTDTVTQFAIADQMKETSKQTRYTTEAQRDIAQSQERTAMAQAKAEVQIQQQYVLMEAERTKRLPIQIAGAVVGLGILSYVYTTVSDRRALAQRQGQRESRREESGQQQRQKAEQQAQQQQRAQRTL